MAKKPEIFKQLEIVAPMIPFPIYWGELSTMKILGANEACLKAMGASRPEEVIGKNPYDYYPKEIAENIMTHVISVVKAGESLTTEDVIRDITTGKTRYYSAIRSPLFDNDKNIVGIVGTSIEITAEKETELFRQEAERHRLEAERLKWENDKHQAIEQKDARIRKLLDTKYRDDQALAVQFLAEDIGEEYEDIDPYEDIRLTLWETQVLFALNHKKNAKSAAVFLSQMLNKPVTHDAVNAIINKHLYLKFNLNSQERLFKKAFTLKKIPFFFPREKEKTQKR